MAFFTTTPHNTFSNPFSDLITLLDTPAYPSYSTYHTPVFHHAPAYHTPTYLTYTPRRLSTPVHRRPSATRRLPSPTVFRRSPSPSSIYQPVSALLTPPTIRKPRVSFMPRFDVRETADAYHLYGELAGVRKNDVEIEFLDVRRMAVRGKIVRDYERGAPVTQAKEQKIEEKKTEETQQEKKTEETQKNEEATATTEPQTSSDAMDVDTDKPAEFNEKPIAEATATTETPVEAATSKAAVESTTETSAPEPAKATEAKAPEDDTHSTAASHAKYQPTVEDSPDEDDRFSITSMSSTPSHSSAASHAAAKAAKAEAAEAEKKKADRERAAREAKEATKRREREEGEAQAKKEQALRMLREAAAEEIRLRRKQEEEQEQEEQEEQMKYWVQERTVGEFERVFEFPERVRREDVHATLENGVLKVVVPKVRDDEVRRVIIY